MATIPAKRSVSGWPGLAGGCTALSEQLMEAFAGSVTARMRNDTTCCMLGEIENRNVLNYFHHRKQPPRKIN